MKRKALVNALDLVKPSVADPALVPIFSNFCFTGETVYGFNEEFAIIAPCKTDEAFGVHAGTLLGILKNSRADTVDFQKDPENVLVKAGKSRVKLPYFDSDMFLLGERDDDWDFEIPIDFKVLHGIEVCLTTSARDNSMPAFMGVTLNAGDGINFYSSDGDALTHYLLDGANDQDLDFSYTMPNQFCSGVLRIGEKALSPESGGTLYANEEWVAAKFDNGFEVYGRVLDNPSESPSGFDYGKLIEQHLQKREPKFIPVPKGMKEALLRASVIGKRESVATVLKVAEKKIKMDTESGIGAIKDIVRVKGDHEDVVASVDPEHVLRSLAVCDEIAIFDNCTCYKNQEEIFQLLSNLGN